MANGTSNAQSTSQRVLRVATVQMESKAGDKAANFAKMESFVEEAAQHKARHKAALLFTLLQSPTR